MSMIENNICARTPEGVTSIQNLREIQRLYNDRKGSFVYDAFEWLNNRVWDNRLPVPLLQWALTPYGGCLGMTRISREPVIITLHPAIWQRSSHGGWRERLVPNKRGWAKIIPAGPRYALDVVIHELVHVEVQYLLGGHTGKSPHDCIEWCEAIERVSERLRGTTLELPPFRAAPTKRIRKDGRHLRRSPPGCISMGECSRWPGSIREPSYHGAQGVPFFER